MKFKLNLITLALLANTGLAVAADGNGSALYGNNCQACHGSITNSDIQTRTVSAIQSAISGNRGGMGFLSTLTSAEIQAIATSLASAVGSGWSHPQFEK
uniref:Lipoprotein cytochrome c n=1 Tax=Geobacter sulfurreducens (strain ATCC 51573 / DSM 12127 / PCA) TaxID=243231 RepID=UPI0037870B76